VIYIGAHIPDISTEEGFFDILYLGIFVILSPAFDIRFYPDEATAPALQAEMVHAVRCFHSLIKLFSARFIVLLGGEPVAHSYVFDRLLAEFAAAAVAFCKAIDETRERASFHIEFTAMVEDVLHKSHSDVFPYYARCLDRGHKDFLWTGPKVEVLPRLDGVVSAIHASSMGEVLDSPTHSIYVQDLEPKPPAQPTAPLPSAAAAVDDAMVVDKVEQRQGTAATGDDVMLVDKVGQRRGRTVSMNLEDQRHKKRRR
jgi:hypothetical protein